MPRRLLQAIARVVHRQRPPAGAEAPELRELRELLRTVRDLA